jgi:hypothetical protein
MVRGVSNEEMVSMIKDEKEPRLQEVTPGMPEPESASDCRFCSLLGRGAAGEGLTQTPSLHFMTEREIRVLVSMRRLKEEASEIKVRMREMGKQGMRAEGSDLSVRLAELREEWKKMDRERTDAAEERMRLLGHIQ